MIRSLEKEERFTILLVEDNAAHAELIKHGFRRHSVPNKIIHVPDGQAALDYLFPRDKDHDDEARPRPHIILLDLHLPRVDGLDVLKAIKSDKHLKSIPVVILTTSKAEQDASRAYDQYANSFVVKPIDFSQFMAMLDELGLYWLTWNYNPSTEHAA